MDGLAINELKDKLAKRLMESGQIPSEQELTDSAESLLSFFEILIEADKKLMKTNELSNNRDSGIAD